MNQRIDKVPLEPSIYSFLFFNINTSCIHYNIIVLFGTINQLNQYDRSGKQHKANERVADSNTMKLLIIRYSLRYS